MLCAVVPLVAGLNGVLATWEAFSLLIGPEMSALVSRALPNGLVFVDLSPRAGLKGIRSQLSLPDTIMDKVMRQKIRSKP